MQGFRSLIRTIVLLAMVSAVAALHAQDGLSAALSRLNACDLSSAFLGPSIAAADFNNDTHPDGAVLLRSENTFHIEVHFRFHQVSRITFASDLPALAISALDVNHDGTPDLVVEEPFSHRPVFIWLNDGYGSFQPAHVEDYPTVDENFCRGLAPPSRNPESLAEAVHGKLRIRHDSQGSCPFAPSAGMAHLMGRTAFHSQEFACSPNLLRGPPSSLPL